MTTVEARKAATNLKRLCTADGCSKRIAKQRMVNAFIHVGREALFCSDDCAHRTSARIRWTRFREKRRAIAAAPMQNAAGTLVPLPPIDTAKLDALARRAS